MPKTDILKQKMRFEIQAYKKPRDIQSLRKTHRPFTGSPQKHPFDAGRVVMVTDPYTPDTGYYEFLTEDISCVEELPSLVNVDGDAVTMVRVWIKKKSVGLHCHPFVVADTTKK